jgi:Ca2+-binding EF-hand superfamily protein
LPKGLPAWFADLDADGDGQIGLYEWQEEGKSLREFRTYDLNDDGFITPEEVIRHMKKPVNLVLRDGRASYQGTIDEMPDETYKDKKSFRVIKVKLERGRTYQIEHISKDMQAFLHVEDPDGNVVVENSSDTIGGLSRIVYRVTEAGVYRIIATSLAGYRTGTFSFTIRVLNPDLGTASQRELPPWFQELDTDQDGQVSIHEWRKGGRNLQEFRQYDWNDDGYITVEEILRQNRKRTELVIRGGRAEYQGFIEEHPEEERYKEKKSYKVLTVWLERGRTYQFEHTSKELQACIHLEDPEGNVVVEHGADGIGGRSRINHHTTEAGLYRIIATSVSGRRPGAFTCSVRVVDPTAAPETNEKPGDLPPWFQELDTDGDGQISLFEWRKGGGDLNEFRRYDRNDDGFITAEEVLRQMKSAPEKNR